MPAGSGTVRLLPPADGGLPGYEQRYGLRTAPFSMSLDVRFALMTEAFAQALDGTARALRRREGLVVITGDTGSGKSLLCRMLLQRLDADLSASMVLDPYLSFEDLLLQVLCDFGALPGGPLAYSGATRQQLLAILKRFLASLASSGAAAVIVIDEAHDLAPAVLQQFRLLSNLETDEAKLLQVVLVGQPRLEEMLVRPELEGIGQRVARRFVLPPLTPSETSRYIERRLATAARLSDDGVVEAGDSRDVSVSVCFTPAAVRAISSRSKGNPRAVNVLCDRVLELAQEHAVLTVGPRYVRAAARSLDAQSGPARRRQQLPALAAAAVLLVGIPGGWYLASVQAGAPTGAATEGAGTAPVAAEVPTPRAEVPVSMGTLSVDDSITILALPSATAADAAEMSSRLIAAGLPAFSRSHAGGHDVIVGPYASAEEAAVAQRQLAARGVSRVRQIANETSSGTGAEAGDGSGGALAALLLVPGRASLVLEMPGEPRQVLVHRSSDRTLDVEAGPIEAPLRPQRFFPPPGVRAVEAVTIESAPDAGSSGSIARARLTVPPMTNGNVRVSGRRVYVDLVQLTPAAVVHAAVTGPVTPADVRPAAGLADVAAPARMAPPATEPERPAPAPAGAYREVITSALQRFEEIQPFLMSAVATPEDQVLAALAGTLRALGTSLRRTDVPPEARSAHDLFSVALEQAGRAVAADFAGDRLAEARQAVSQFSAAKTRLQDVL